MRNCDNNQRFDVFFDVFIAYHGTHDLDGSSNKAKDIYDILVGYGIKPYFYPVISRNDARFSDTPVYASRSTVFLLVANENIPLEDNQLSIDSEIYRELLAYMNYHKQKELRKARIYAYGSLTAKAADKITPCLSGVDHFSETDQGAETEMARLIEWVRESCVEGRNGLPEACEYDVACYDEFDKLECELTQDLGACFDNLMDDRFYREIVKSTSGQQQNVIPYTIDAYEFLTALKSGRSMLLLPARFGGEFSDLAKKLRLENDGFSYWQLDFDFRKEDKEIHICSVCFGAIMAHNYITRDYKFLHVATDDRTGFMQAVKRAKEGAIDFLVAFRSEQYTWLSKWHFFTQRAADGLNPKFDEGTTNQTTLSASALLVCGFLPSVSECSGSAVSGDMLDLLSSRYRYLEKSIGAIIAGKIVVNQNASHINYCGWGYMLNITRQAQPHALPTAFALDTLLKFHQIICEWMDVLPADNELSNEMQTITQQIVELIPEVVEYFFVTQHDNGSFSANNQTYRRQLGNGYADSSAHTAKVLKTMLSIDPVILNSFGDNHKEKLSTIINKAIYYLAGSTLDKVAGDEIFVYEEFRFGRGPNDIDIFEHSADFLYISALVKAAEWKRENGDRRAADELFAKVITAYRHFQGEEYKHGVELVRGTNDYEPDTYTTLVRGRNPSLQYPIYRQYYYHMAICDMLKYIKDVKNEVERLET